MRLAAPREDVAVSARAPARVAVLVAIVAGCGGGQTQGAAFEAQWQSDDGVAIGKLEQKLAKVIIPVGADVAVAVAGPETLLGLPLDGGAAWSFKHALDSRPAVAGTVVVGLGAGRLFALDAVTGKELWQRDAEGALRGVGDDGKTTVVSIAARSGAGSVVLAVTRDGHVIRQIEDAAAIGVPAVVDGYAFLPWQGQYVTAYDLAGGDEEARALLRTPTSRAFTTAGALFFGEVAATRFDDRIRLAGAGQASTVSLTRPELPGAPKWMTPGADPPPLTANAADEIRLYARPTRAGAIAIDGDRFAATYYRVALGFAASTGAIAWAHLHDAVFLGGDAYAGGVALCDAHGKVTFLDADTGAVSGSGSFGRPIEACVVQADGVKKAAAPAEKPLAAQIAACVESPEQELATIQRFLLRELIAQKDAWVTKALVDLVTNARTSPALAKEARGALAGRTNGQAYMLAALERHVGAKIVAPLADALAAMNERSAAPLLAKHLIDPTSAPDDVAHAAAALATLATKDEAPILKTFFATHRVSRGLEREDRVDAAVVSVAQALVRLGEGSVVAAAAADPSTSPAVKEKITPLVKR
jgi:outer membrane protein assembly factor BamB